MASQKLKFPLLAITLVVGMVAAKPDCSSSERASVNDLVKAASAIKFDLQKTPAPHRCILFKARIVRAASDGGHSLDDATGEDESGKYKRIVEMFAARAESIERTSPHAGSGLRSLIAFMDDCSGNMEIRAKVRDYGAPRLATEPARAETTGDGDTLLSHQLELEELRKRVRALEEEVKSLMLANQDQGERLQAKSRVNMMLRDQLEGAEQQLKDLLPGRDARTTNPDDFWKKVARSRLGFAQFE